MNEFVLKEIKNTDLEKELETIGFDESYRGVACKKYEYKNLKIFDLTLPQANILKQTAISYGADCAVHREILTAKVEKTDCILGGSISTLKKIASNLKNQPFGMGVLASRIEDNLSFKLSQIEIKGQIFDYSRPYLVGVVNITTNSFSDGGKFFELEPAKAQIVKLIEDGADVIELGAESTKPFSSSVSAQSQLEKLIPLLKFIKAENIKTPISIDTRNSEVANMCLDEGADIINDVSGFEYDSELVNVVSKYACPVIIQHTKGRPENMQVSPEYQNLTDEIFKDLKKRLDYALSVGIKKENIILDVGIGFGKTREDNFNLIKRCEEFKSLNQPLMYGISRKSLLGMPEAPNREKDIFTLALNSILISRGINFLRVHNVEIHKKYLDMIKNTLI
jgi:dihydropteroate synthase